MKHCPICEVSAKATGLTVNSAPLFHLLPKAEKLNRSHFGDINLYWCMECDHYFNSLAEEAPSLGPQFATNRSVSQEMTLRHEALRDFLLSRSTSAKSVLDIGAGSGGYSRAFLEAKCDVVAVEPRVDLSSLATQCLVVEDGWPTEHLSGKTFDLILCVQVLEHLSNPVQAVTSIMQHLKPDGLAYIEIPSADWLFDHSALLDIHLQHRHYFTEDSFGRLLVRCGAKVLERRSLLSGRDTGYLIQMESESTRSSRTPRFRMRTHGLQTAADHLSQYQFLGLATALYGVGFATQAFLGWLPKSGVAKAFDDTADYWGNDVYSSHERISVFEPTSSALKGLEHIIISSYVHDKVISERLASRGYVGRISSLRPATAVSGGPPSLFS